MNKKDVSELLEIINDEQKKANEHYKFHVKDGNKYHLAEWFNGQRALLRKLKRKIKK